MDSPSSPVFDRTRSLRLCLDSLMAQSYRLSLAYGDGPAAWFRRGDIRSVRGQQCCREFDSPGCLFTLDALPSGSEQAFPWSFRRVQSLMTHDRRRQNMPPSWSLNVIYRVAAFLTPTRPTSIFSEARELFAGEATPPKKRKGEAAATGAPQPRLLRRSRASSLCRPRTNRAL